MFGEDYLELLAFSNDTEHNRPTQEYLKKGEGTERVAFTTDDAAAGAEELKARGLGAARPGAFLVARSTCRIGGTGAMRNSMPSAGRWTRRPGNMRIFACQHLDA